MEPTKSVGFVPARRKPKLSTSGSLGSHRDVRQDMPSLALSGLQLGSTSPESGATMSPRSSLLSKAMKSCNTSSMRKFFKISESSSMEDVSVVVGKPAQERQGGLSQSSGAVVVSSDAYDSHPALYTPLHTQLMKDLASGAELTLPLQKLCKGGDIGEVLDYLKLHPAFLNVAKRKRVSSFKAGTAIRARDTSDARPHPRISLGGSRQRRDRSKTEICRNGSSGEESPPQEQSPAASPRAVAEKKAEVGKGEPGSQWTALHVACKYDKEEVVDVLCGIAGIDVNQKNSVGMTPLHVACLHGSSGAAHALLESEAVECKDVADHLGRTALHFAALRGSKELIAALFKFGFTDVLAEDSEGLNAISFAYALDHVEVAEFLFAHLSLLDPQPTSLNLSGCGMSLLPPDDVLETLTALEVLDISHNSIDVLPPLLASMPSLREVRCHGNPLSGIPDAFRSQGWPVMVGYLKKLAGQMARWGERNIIVIGQPGVGRKTLISRLNTTNQSFRASFMPTKKKAAFSVEAEELDVRRISLVKSKSKDVHLVAWLLGDEIISQPTHQAFFYGDPMIMLVVDMKNLNMGWLDAWFQELKTCRRGARSIPIFLVATNLDHSSCTDAFVSRTMQYLKQQYPLQKVKGMYPDNFFAVSSTDGRGIHELRDKLLKAVAGDDRRAKLLPPPTSTACLVLHQWIMTVRDYEQATCITWVEYERMAKICRVKDSELLACTDFIASTGLALPLTELLRGDPTLDLMVLDVSWLAQLLSKIISPANFEIVNGVISRSSVGLLLPQFDNSMHYRVMMLLTKYRIFYPLPSPSGQPDQFLVPCLLPTNRPPGFAEVWPTFPSAKQYECRRLYRFEMLPIGFVARLMSELLFLPGLASHLLWRDGIFLQHGTQQAYITFKQLDRLAFEAEIQVRYPQVGSSAASIMRMTTEMIDTLLEANYPHLLFGVTKLMPCVHCLMKRTLTVDPFLFTYEEVILAITTGSPFVFCHHILSPSRCVRIDKLAPDISFADIKQISDGDFRTGKLLGKGAFGSVYHGVLKVADCEQRKRHKRQASKEAMADSAAEARGAGECSEDASTEIAIKELNFSIEGSDLDKVESFGEFQREAFIMSHLHHPNLVCMFGICLSTPPPRLLMEFVPHGDLYALLRQKEAAGETLPMWLIRDMALDIALGMDHLHSISPPIIHRDLRSPNIFLASLEQSAKVKAKVADFGLSRMITSNKVQGVLGSWQWMAPETLDASGSGDVEYDSKADVYSFGIILWELLTVAFPFDEFLADERFGYLGPKGVPSFNIQEMKKAICEEGLRPSVPEDTPKDLKKLLKCCWERESSARPDFKEVAKMLDPDVEFVTSMEIDAGQERAAQRDEDAKPELVHQYQCSKQFSLGNLMVLCDDSPLATCACPVGERVFVGCRSGAMVVFDMRSDAYGELESSWVAHKDSIYAIVHCRSTNVVWSCGADGYVHLYPPNASWEYDAIKTWPMPQKARKIALKAMALIKTDYSEQMWCACAQSGTIWAWNVVTHELEQELELGKQNPVVYLQQKGDVVWVASYENIFLVSAKDMTVLGNFVAHPRSLIGALAASGSQVWSAGHDGNIHVWEYEKGEVQCVKSLTAHAGKVLCLSVDAFGHIWSGSFDKSIIVWDPLATFPIEELVDVHEDSVRTIVRVGAQVWSIGQDSMIAIWEKNVK